VDQYYTLRTFAVTYLSFRDTDSTKRVTFVHFDKVLSFWRHCYT